MFISKPQTRSTCLTAISLVLAFALPQAWALPTINLTNSVYSGVAASASGSLDSGVALFRRDALQPSGTGVFNPFLRLDCQGNGCDQQGYNTNAINVLDNKSPVNWTHDVLLSDLKAVTIGALDYYQFTLDINEPGNNKSLLSLDGLRLYSTSVSGQSGQDVDINGDVKNAPPTSKGIEGTVLWDMDAGKSTTGSGGNGTAADRSVLLDATVGPTLGSVAGPGSGKADMAFLVQKTVIDAVWSGSAKNSNCGTIDNQTGAAGCEKYLILWSRFGMSQGATGEGSTTSEAGFEEWAYTSKTGGGGGGGCTTNCNQAPTPGTASLALLALGILGFRHLSRKTPVVAV